MNSKLKLSLPNKGRWINTDHNEATSELKKENWKTLEYTKKKLKKNKHDPNKILDKFRKIHRKKYDYSKLNYLGLTKI
jgi:hypothetical protein